MEKLTAAVSDRKSGLVSPISSDFDMLYGHRKDVEGFAKSLEEFDRMLGDFLPLLSLSDLLMITADHAAIPIRAGPPPTIPVSTCRFWRIGRNWCWCEPRRRDTLADMGQTIAENFGTAIPTAPASSVKSAASSQTPRDRQSRSTHSEKKGLAHVDRIISPDGFSSLFSLVVFGIQHFLYANSWRRWCLRGCGALFWAYFVGVAFVAAAIGAVVPKMTRPAGFCWEYCSFFRCDASYPENCRPLAG